MRNLIIGIFLCILSGCQKKAIPVITTRTADPPPPLQTQKAAADIDAGKTVFSSHCNRCHDLPDPAKYIAPRWEGILARMMPRARLTAQERVDVTAYIKANCAR